MGPGLHYLFGDGARDDSNSVVTSSSSFSKVSPTLFASLSVSFLPFPNRVRLFGGLEARGYFFSTVGVRELSRTVPAAGGSIGLFFGGELLWGSTERSAR